MPSGRVCLDIQYTLKKQSPLVDWQVTHDDTLYYVGATIWVNGEQFSCVKAIDPANYNAWGDRVVLYTMNRITIAFAEAIMEWRPGLVWGP